MLYQYMSEFSLTEFLFADFITSTQKICCATHQNAAAVIFYCDYLHVSTE